MKNQNQIPNQKQDNKNIDSKNFNTKDTDLDQDKNQDQKNTDNVKSMESARAGKSEAPEAASSKPFNAGSEDKGGDQQWQGKARTADVDAEGENDMEGIEGKGQQRHAESPDARSAKGAKSA